MASGAVVLSPVGITACLEKNPGGRSGGFPGGAADLRTGRPEQGDYGVFDGYIRLALLDAKEQYPQIALVQLSSYQKTGRHLKLWAGFHGIFCPPIPPDTPKRPYIVNTRWSIVVIS